MKVPIDWLKSSWHAGKHILRPVASPSILFIASCRPAMVPIRTLGARHRQSVSRHLLKLDKADRYLRFGYAASDEQVQRYVQQLDFDRDQVFGIYNRRLELIAMAHLAYAPPPEHRSCAEFGVSVLKQARGKGLGRRLFDHAIVHARTRGVRMMFIHALSENTAMLKIARKAGAEVTRDGSESEAYLQLPPAGFDTHMGRMVNRQFAEVDYQLKKQARQFWSFLAGLQEVRKGVREGRHKAGA
ncbi:GNAT family N-acetyltransferase [Comamonas endophytica]|uniref:GNAT family N-acetyltransferase n=1 Tax=Comamonas endophytica TaxID=2949090 RepID=A0ABY6G7P5_9BURK|nr:MULTISPECIES: GNAT family N-acetyltransferase [unclassified Acidovorax]MCD2511074.1 GNAT family N-acetyltransferase [Acidovorax sp. D4N7]UYG50479.1 GNAT family N-acetyltransferase [Acidovorax sp. 5MLIR]